MLKLVCKALTGILLCAMLLYRHEHYTPSFTQLTSTLNTRFLVTAVALDGIGSTLQPLFRIYCVIYELDGKTLILSVLVAGLISVVMLWFPDFWSLSMLHSRVILEQVHMEMLWF